MVFPIAEEDAIGNPMSYLNLSCYHYAPCVPGIYQASNEVMDCLTIEC